MFDHATVAEVQATCADILGVPLRDALGDAYGDVEQFVLETLMGIDSPDHAAILDKLGAQFGPGRASEMVIGMTLLIQAQMRASRRH
ncbi:MAG: hypothetical protein V4472_25010 [Pseudomonadota bacterium]